LNVSVTTCFISLYYFSKYTNTHAVKWKLHMQLRRTQCAQRTASAVSLQTSPSESANSYSKKALPAVKCYIYCTGNDTA
jgi:hypothetical protein